MKAAAFYPSNRDGEIAKSLGRDVADQFKNAISAEKEARSATPQDQIAIAVALLSINVRTHNNNVAAGLQTYGPPAASAAQYANVVLNCEKCLINSQMKSKGGVPVPPGTKSGQENGCDNCLEKADKERAQAYISH